MKKSFLRRLDNLSKDITAENADTVKIFALVHNQTDGLRKPEKKQKRAKVLRVVFTAAMSVVMVFSVATAASAEFREMVFGMFTVTSTERIADGLEKDRFVIFDEALTESQSVGVSGGVIFKTDLETLSLTSFYEYKNGALDLIETQTINTVITDGGKEYPVDLIYGYKSSGELFVWDSRFWPAPPQDDETSVVIITVPGRDDVIYLKLWTGNAVYGTNDNNVLFDLTTFEITQTDLELLPIDPDMLFHSSWDLKTYDADDWINFDRDLFTDRVTGEKYRMEDMAYGYLSPNREWLAFSKKHRGYNRMEDGTFELDNDILTLDLYHTQTQRRFNLEHFLDGRGVWSFGWLADGVLAVIADNEGEHYKIPGYEWLRTEGRHMYVFRIIEDFLTEY
ncbi:MAG: hypothetical protein FWE60_02150 [Oscillospiraceae bacterium]|nr:hypothetical protein [Oscillospiraceae bacterium]